MEEKEKYSFITRPGAATFFTWIALSAAIFFGAYSVKIHNMYKKEVTELNEVKRVGRELSYRLELSSVKIKDSAETLQWANVEIDRLRKRNDDVLEKSANLRKLLYAAVKKNQMSKEGLGLTNNSEQISFVEPKVSKVKAEVAKSDLGNEVLFSDISDKDLIDGSAFEKIIQKSSELSKESREVVAEVLTYNPNSKKVFISLGRSNAKISEGNRFAIWRNGKHVTDIRVAQVHAVTSTCEVISPVLDSVRAGDTAELIKVSAY